MQFALLDRHSHPQEMDAPAALQAHVRARAPEHDDGPFTCRPAGVAQSGKRSGVARVRRGGHQHEMSRQPPERRHRRAPIERDGGVRLVHDHQVPGDRGEAPEHLGSLGEVERDDHNRTCRPRIHVGRQRDDAPPDRRQIHDRRVYAEAVRQLGRPLVAQAGRDQHEGVPKPAARLQFGYHQSGLDRLAEAHLVGEQDAGSQSIGDGHRRLELPGEEVDRGRAGRAQRSGRRPSDHEPGEPRRPAPPRRVGHCLRCDDRERSIEGGQKGAHEAPVRDSAANETQRGAAVERPERAHAPVVAAKANEASGDRR